MSKFVVGIDYGTSTVRAILIDITTSEEIGIGIVAYAHGENGVIFEKLNPSVARHHPADYPIATKQAIAGAVAKASRRRNFRLEQIIGIGISATASTPLPLDKDGNPLAYSDPFRDDIDALAWLWKDHSSVAEAEEITEILKKKWPEPLARIGGFYSAEWFWAKLLRFSRIAPNAYRITATWIEIGDWIAGWLCGFSNPFYLTRNICMAGHKALYDHCWNGFPSDDVLEMIDPVLVRMGKSLQGEVLSIGDSFGKLTKEAATYLGLPPGIVIAVPEIDAHIGTLAAGIKPGRMVKIFGTSGVDLAIVPTDDKSIISIPGISGTILHSIIPGFFTIEAGQNAIGDIYDWYTQQLCPHGETHASLTDKAEKLCPGETGLLGLDWHNGNRTILVDQKLSGLLVGMNLHTRPEHIYRALIEATAFGSKIIIDHLRKYNIYIEEIVACGGIPSKNTLVMQIFADILECPLKIPASTQTSALGAAITAIIAVERQVGKNISIQSTVARMASFNQKSYLPNQENIPIYRSIYALYKDIHNSFGTNNYRGDLQHIMKQLISIQKKVIYSTKL